MTRPTLAVVFRDASLSTSADLIAAGVVRRIQIRKGQAQPFGPPVAGSCVLTLDNSDRAFDPTYSSGTYYAWLDQAVTVSADGSRLFIGDLGLNRWSHKWTPPADAISTVQTFDALARVGPLVATEALGVSSYTPGAALQLAVQQADGLYDVLADGVTGSPTVNDIDTGDSFATYVRNVMDGEMGWFFVSAFVPFSTSTRFRLRGRQARWAASAVTFTDDPASDAELEYVPEDLVLLDDQDDVYGGVSATRDGGVTQYWPESGYTAPELPLGGLVLTSDTEARIVAVHRFQKAASVRFTSLTLRPDEVDTDEMWDFVMGLWVDGSVLIGSRVTVIKTWPGGSTIERDCFIEGYEMDIAPFADGAWTVTLWLSDAEAWPADAFQIGTDSVGGSKLIG